MNKPHPLLIANTKRWQNSHCNIPNVTFSSFRVVQGYFCATIVPLFISCVVVRESFYMSYFVSVDQNASQIFCSSWNDILFSHTSVFGTQPVPSSSLRLFQKYLYQVVWRHFFLLIIKEMFVWYHILHNLIGWTLTK